MGEGRALAFTLAVFFIASRAAAQGKALEPEHVVTGIEEEGRAEGDAGREFANALLWLPRTLIDYTFRGAAEAARYVADEQLVPRYREALGAPPGSDVFIFPTLFAETGKTFNAGVRMLVDTPSLATFERVGFGGIHDLVSESRVLVKGPRGRVPFVVSIEAFFEEESEIEYHGLGIVPSTDPRNQFQPGTEQTVGLYLERHTRALGSLGLRLAPELEFFLSLSLARRQVEDTPDAEAEALSRVFVLDSLPGAGDDNTWIGYAEMAARFDSRRHRGRPVPGAVVEAYTGGAQSTEGTRVSFMRIGWRAGGYIPIYRRSNILSPVLRFDRLVPLGGLPVPFNEVPRQPDFRGFDTRRDFVSMVGSLDYTWEVVSFLGLRVFLDTATVAPSVAELSFEQLEELRYSGGFGFDLYSDKAQLGQLLFSASPEGLRVLFSLGEVERFGDRQHRE
jgi:hypothetical protein